MNNKLIKADMKEAIVSQMPLKRWRDLIYKDYCLLGCEAGVATQKSP
jgi:hypothetical protein